MMVEDDDPLIIVSKFEEYKCLQLKKWREYMGRITQRRIKETESWKSTVQKKRQDLKERQNKLHEIDLEEKIHLTEQRALEEEERNQEVSISLLKQDVSELTVKKKRLEQEWEENKEKAKKTYQALLSAMAYHKLKLKCYIDLDKADSTQFIFSFLQDSDKRKSLMELNYCVTLDFCEGEWKVIQMKPPIACEKEISLYLRETKDIVGFISHVHDVYAELTKHHK